MAAFLNNQSSRGKVLLTGASSQLGVFLIPRLLGCGFRVIAISRRAGRGWKSGGEKLDWLRPDESGLDSHPGDGAPPGPAGGVSALVSCGPLDLALRAVSHHASLRRAVVFSTSSVFSKARSTNKRENRQIEGILRQESDLQGLCEERGLSLLCLRPTLIYGCGLDRNISLLASWISRFGWLPLAGSAAGLRQPVHADDLARAAVEALTRESPLTLDSPACGGDTISYRRMVELVFDGLGRPRRIISLPAGLMATLVGLVSMLPAYRGLNREMVRRQNSDLVFDDTPLRQALDYNPRPFKPLAADFEIPDTARKYRSGP